MALIEKYVTQWLPEASRDFLDALCNEFKIIVPQEKIGKHQEVLKLVYRYLSSAELESTDDKGAAVYYKLFNELGQDLGKGKPKVEAHDDSGGGSGSETPLTYHKLREFKISGSIDGGKKVL